ncbi:hypothetical protein A3K34_04360 [candidate division WWE3 bacterium RIFOXYC1_FULL_40_10]|uniref:Baseplate protein J-like domain-containing protein n=1 Tax=candidate division WWE3 bacterium RIFOXYA2_FULL_46_9 TaxID=1802636 RepID=A0A1F4W157_UNCKA|nr:MAG: hypothetical protein A3K58_04360 [candidate division WWE3 bacterium RIFOXYB1_FULL_40_22]OGC62075.1 MAG: hypothetical protein A3K37_04360 [candidate division WWE3 bacterium RIFOXYA1_FULL_40_11]OGC63090.1 MAG: hypothetical protein A2264_00105 [candidate division WWE3 bacterium RIFOXYA2_FULL_46_9]OGC64980.1 MAG: hypothetical protein A2326_03005 [candidate division WWE3 bacterium RIFOXYB2_FULL_41_6]OGC66458.1 MAG: hypothetical protein A3K34_04360 [candidate division WWE3 bacterium RIFOXYC1_
MTKLELEIYEDVFAVTSKIKELNDSGIELIIPQGSVLFENILNLKLLKAQADKFEKTVQFTTKDTIGNTLIEMLEDKRDTFTSTEPETESPKEIVAVPKYKFNFPKINMKAFKLPKSNKAVLLIPLILVLFGALYWYVGKKQTKAFAQVVVKTEPLVRSVTVRIDVNQVTNPETKILKGATLATTYEGTQKIPTTGEKIEGEKAEGEIIIYNMTDTEVKLSKGTELTYDKESLKFELKDAVTVAGKSLTSTDETEGTGTYVFGEAKASIRAKEIGAEYNLDKGRDLLVKNYSISEIKVKTNQQLSGGKSEKISVVTQEDRTALSTKLLEENKQLAGDLLKKQLKSGEKLVAGSESIAIVKESFDFKVDDKAKELTLVQSVEIKGLVYKVKELEELLDKLADNLIPDGYKAANQAKEIKAEVLGNSDGSVVTPLIADIQATLKTYIIPDYDEAKLKQQLLNKNPAESQKILGGLRDIKTYEFKITPGIPFFQRVPTDPNLITIKVVTE